MPRADTLSFAVIGCGFWAGYQIAAWRELDGVTLAAVCDRDPERATAAALRFGAGNAYTDAETMLRAERLDFVDIISDADGHAPLVEMAARYGVAAITQKPMAPDLASARRMLDAASQAEVGLYVHENFRWQAPLRRLKALLDGGAVGKVFRGHLAFNSAFPVFDNQPALAGLQNFILMDVGTHVLDVARFLFGEAATLHCKTRRVNPNIQGEDVATILMEMRGGAHCTVELSYASLLEQEAFPQTLALIEGQGGSLRLGLGGEIALTTRAGTVREAVTPRLYPWADPAYAVAQSAIVDCHRNLLDALTGRGQAETTGADNMKTLQLVFACYESAHDNRVISFDPEETDA